MSGYRSEMNNMYEALDTEYGARISKLYEDKLQSDKLSCIMLEPRANGKTFGMLKDYLETNEIFDTRKDILESVIWPLRMFTPDCDTEILICTLTLFFFVLNCDQMLKNSIVNQCSSHSAYFIDNILPLKVDKLLTMPYNPINVRWCLKSFVIETITAYFSSVTPGTKK
jgi:hypothetical protein